eukprot:9650128-Alexandrium_andersonii.AAC.1
MTRLWAKLQYQRKGSPELADAWKQAEALPRGNVRVAKREILYTWLREQMKVARGAKTSKWRYH